MNARTKVVEAAVAASDSWTDPDGFRAPAGAVHAWVRGLNQTVCGLPLARARLSRFAHVAWSDVQPQSGGHADAVRAVCPSCLAATRRSRDDRPWQRRDPRP